MLEALEVDYIDESEVLTPADEANHIDKWKFKVPFVCGATNLGEALRRIAEGAAMIRTKGEAGTGNVVEAVRHMRAITGEIRRLSVARRGRAAHRRQGAAGAARARPRWSPRTGELPVVQLLGRRHRHPGGRRADDAARRRGRVRRLRASSSPRTRSARAARDRRGHHALRRPRARRRAPRATSGEPMAGHRDRARSASRACSSTAAGSAARSSACSPSRATSRPTRGMLARLGAEAREVRTPGRPRRARRARDPGRRVAPR